MQYAVLTVFCPGIWILDSYRFQVDLIIPDVLSLVWNAPLRRHPFWPFDRVKQQDTVLNPLNPRGEKKKSGGCYDFDLKLGITGGMDGVNVIKAFFSLSVPLIRSQSPIPVGSWL
ncbi:hypothetical protein BO86DRAFT_61300 [Aspergillus japonicus CBS 114.51]|uniref:Uncharacterized protein n=1 Tax=Aspergillus japonicus CBS 114.51 TaxID=1448312 RepID=A0A8T8X4N7_ASPJA|nr:hypothetical protein BO86DRAFT_61300 [Aspergillus japonicus CBS 114.51]RAH83107.1 hypothetical protein BO86DRAFT_61300 [Aspergillus japonicus CBS 114.51]